MKDGFIKKLIYKVAGILIMVSSPLASISTSAHTLSEDKFAQVEGTMLYVSEGASVNVDTHVNEYLSMPENVRVKLASEGCKIYLDTTTEEGGYLTYGKYTSSSRVAGLFYGNYIDILSDRDIITGQNLIHEVGHFVDNNSYGGMPVCGTYYAGSSAAEWLSIWVTESAAISSLSSMSRNNSYNHREGFATTYALYVTSPDALKEAAPQAYSYIEKCLATIS